MLRGAAHWMLETRDKTPAVTNTHRKIWMYSFKRQRSPAVSAGLCLLGAAVRGHLCGISSEAPPDSAWTHPPPLVLLAAGIPHVAAVRVDRSIICLEKKPDRHHEQHG
ncbi:hypothetical protein EYF80_044613 [Liparis tanakae]|uniref:Uncharacterized protein n=1 Tax=Liparis tanakae TaxID=230148 RepID=A0A4Z2FWP2_9TELE|nr:hypothetical protein EYF80_044613 [Liparis tanakae]